MDKDALQSRLRDTLFSDIDQMEGAKLYVLVDTVLHDPLARVPAREKAVSLPISYAGIPSDRRPYLAPLGDIGRDFSLDDSLSVAIEQALREEDHREFGRSVCGWVASHATTEILAKRLAECSVMGVNYQRRLFRYWDPRVLDLLSWALTSKQRENFFSCASGWWWLGRDASLRKVIALESDSWCSSQVVLGNEQLQVLMLAESTNRTLDVLQDMDHASFTSELQQRVAKAMRKAVETWELDTQEEQIRYALFAVLIGPEFDAHPLVRGAMLKAKEERRSPLSGLDAFTDDWWSSLKVELQGAQLVRDGV
ncbi:DUF4123 domain-containing protein [Cupriavidus sp. H39]|uniref:DUF4123 domain-containing protein n=1 Tax=Cupriavidus sp. H39 TaxID=3401635 RepID=UPI003CFFCA8D